MRITRKNSQLQIAVNRFETGLLRQVLRALIENYQVKPDQFDAQGAAAWYSTRGCTAANMSADETREWLQHLHGFKSARLGLLERLSRQLAAGQEVDRNLLLNREEAPELLTALNDHRLLLAAQHHIGQEEMDMRWLEDFGKLKPAQRTALFDIHLLAQLIEELLRHISPEAASWMGE